MSTDFPGTHWVEQDGLHIDVRGLGPPDPMVAILGHLETPGQSGPVTVHHDRNPIYLFPELAERGWTSRQIPGEDGEIRLLLTLLT
jgi:hypothetical protein